MVFLPVEPFERGEVSSVRESFGKEILLIAEKDADEAVNGFIGEEFVRKFDGDGFGEHGVGMGRDGVERFLFVREDAVVGVDGGFHLVYPFCP